MTTDGVIYAIKDNTNKNIYIGSCLDFNHRKQTHESSFKHGKNETTAFLILQNKNYEWEILEKVTFDDIKELRIIEKYHIIKNKETCVNKVLPFRTDAEAKEYYENYRRDNKEMISIRQKIYNDGRKDVKKEYDHQYNKNNLEKRKEQGKKYRDSNKEKLNTNNK